MKIVLLGANGQLGRSFLKHNKSANIIPYDRVNCDVTNKKLVNDIIAHNAPDFVINASAYTDVDKAQEDARDAYKINSNAVSHIADACSRYDVGLIHFSTDFIFKDEEDEYDEFQPLLLEDKTPSPANIYGDSKYCGEMQVQIRCTKHLIFRVSWLFSEFGNNFVAKILTKVNEKSIKVVDDMYGCPTCTKDLVENVFKVLEGEIEWGLYHYCSAPTSKYLFAEYILNQYKKITDNKIPKLEPCKTSDFPSTAERPKTLVMGTDLVKRTYNMEIPHWKDGVKYVVDFLEGN